MTTHTLSPVPASLTPVQIDVADLQADADAVGRSAWHLASVVDLFDHFRHFEASHAERVAMEQAIAALLREVARGLQATRQSIARSAQCLEQGRQS